MEALITSRDCSFICLITWRSPNAVPVVLFRPTRSLYLFPKQWILGNGKRFVILCEMEVVSGRREPHLYWKTKWVSGDLDILEFHKMSQCSSHSCKPVVQKEVYCTCPQLNFLDEDDLDEWESEVIVVYQCLLSYFINHNNHLYHWVILTCQLADSFNRSILLHFLVSSSNASEVLFCAFLHFWEMDDKEGVF